jgi:hypothetical protein
MESGWERGFDRLCDPRVAKVGVEVRRHQPLAGADSQRFADRVTGRVRSWDQRREAEHPLPAGAPELSAHAVDDLSEGAVEGTLQPAPVSGGQRPGRSAVEVRFGRTAQVLPVHLHDRELRDGPRREQQRGVERVVDHQIVCLRPGGEREEVPPAPARAQNIGGHAAVGGAAAHVVPGVDLHLEVAGEQARGRAQPGEELHSLVRGGHQVDANSRRSEQLTDQVTAHQVAARVRHGQVKDPISNLHAP